MKNTNPTYFVRVLGSCAWSGPHRSEAAARREQAKANRVRPGHVVVVVSANGSEVL
jgi:hypothetical protein